MKLRYLFDWYITPRVMGGAILLAIMLLTVTLSILLLTRHEAQLEARATAVLNVIPAPTATQPPPTTIPTSPGPTSPPEVLTIGKYVQVSGTGGDGLRLRDVAGLNGKVLLLGEEGEVFLVKDGPKETDNFTWWYLVNPTDEGRQGWAVADYLKVVQYP